MNGDLLGSQCPLIRYFPIEVNDCRVRSAVLKRINTCSQSSFEVAKSDFERLNLYVTSQKSKCSDMHREARLF